MIANAHSLMRGDVLAARIAKSVSQRAKHFCETFGRRPCLVAVLVGSDSSSETYVRMKRRRAEAHGVESQLVALPDTASTSDVVRTLQDLSQASSVDGILLQHPVPATVDERRAFEAIDPEKDVDGVTIRSFGSMALGYPGFVSCTPGGIIRLLDEHGVKLDGMEAVVIGRSPILGRPLGMLLLARDATVTYCHSRTRDLPKVVRRADLVVAAVGVPEFVRGHWLKDGVVVVDAGYNEGNIGDVAFTEALERAHLITPVPGGVGPMTIAVLLDQTVDAAYRQKSAHAPC